MNESERTIRRAVEMPSHRIFPTPRRSASNSDFFCATTWRDIQGEEPDRKLPSEMRKQPPYNGAQL
jgi:hypothetical protein